MTRWFDQIRSSLEIPIIRLGHAQITLWAILSFFALATALFWVAALIRRMLVHRVLARTNLELGVREAIGSMVRYVVLLAGSLGILQSAGVDLTALSVFAGAIGIGLGLGLQNITNNFISGLIILIERPVKVGDRIEVGGVDGDVVEIGGRSTRILTNDNITIIVPNSRLVAENVVNWKHTDNRVRFRVPVSVAYGTPTRLVEQILLDIARSNPDVLQDPEPEVWFRNFGESALNFELLAWNSTLVDRRGRFLSDLNHAILESFIANKIEIPFPQRVIHLPGLKINTDGGIGSVASDSNTAT